MKLSNSVKQKVLLQELESHLKKIDKDTCKEAVFSHFMDTKRLFRADYLCPNAKIIIEINGGQWVNGRHNRGGIGYENDLTKLNLAQVNGYKILQFTYEMLERGEHLKI